MRWMFCLVWLGCCAPASASAQVISTLYTTGTPHTNRNGTVQFEYDSDSFLPIGIFDATADVVGEMKKAYFNVVLPSTALTVHQANTTIAAAKRDDVQVVEFDRLGPVSRFRHFRNNPAILGWYLLDEPNLYLSPANVPAFEERVSQIRANDPRHPLFVNLGGCFPNTRPADTMWAQFGDIGMLDAYTLLDPTQSVMTASQLLTAPAEIDGMVALNSAHRPTWIVLQSFSLGSNASGQSRFLTPMEMRATIYLSVVHGATGFFHFTHDSPSARTHAVIGIGAKIPVAYPTEVGIPPCTATDTQQIAGAQLWSEVLALNQELLSLQSAILSPTATTPYSIAPSAGGTPIHAILKRRNNRQYTLIAVNASLGPTNATFQFTGKSPAVVQNQSGGQQWLIPPAAQSWSFTDRFAPLDVHIYQYTGQ